jgi:hypothetical protein
MQKMEELRDMLCEELEKITKKGELSAGSLDVVDKLTHSIKSIDTIIAMEESGYSKESNRGGHGGYSRNYMYEDGGSYARGGRGGRGGRTGANQYGSYDDGSEMIVRELRDLMNDAPNEHIKMELKKTIQKMEQM